MLAIVVLLLLHVPPLTVLVSEKVLPEHTVDAPVIVPAIGVLFTVMVLVAVAVPHVFVLL